MTKKKIKLMLISECELNYLPPELYKQFKPTKKVCEAGMVYIGNPSKHDIKKINGYIKKIGCE